MCRPKGLLRFFRRFGLKTVKDFAHLSGIGYSFRGSYGGVWTYLSIGSKWLRYKPIMCEFEMDFKKYCFLLALSVSVRMI